MTCARTWISQSSNKAGTFPPCCLHATTFPLTSTGRQHESNGWTCLLLSCDVTEILFLGSHIDYVGDLLRRELQRKDIKNDIISFSSSFSSLCLRVSECLCLCACSVNIGMEWGLSFSPFTPSWWRQHKVWKKRNDCHGLLSFLLFFCGLPQTNIKRRGSETIYREKSIDTRREWVR